MYSYVGDKRSMYLRFICFDNLQKGNKTCVDFEARFCCPDTSSLKNKKEKRSTDTDNSLWIEYMETEPKIPDKIDELRKF